MGMAAIKVGLSSSKLLCNYSKFAGSILSRITGVHFQCVKNQSTMSVSCPSKNAKGACPAELIDLKSKMGLIVLQEWWGLNDQIKAEAALICKMGGFTTIVPDLYRGKKTIDNEEA